ncbi:HD domain-containing protein [Paragemmobacter straminiformis]|uniref:ATP-binding protein n=1 Tax=Paragemmobacter straminiformis TaxID=2045119 RepID=A0A842I8Z4_9RHOB|nr:ATP-binding protein [Gemmobacter straminiformis]MBC2836522.1 ATP-binding protein [Gemmobacter straminiformis]
MGFRDSNIWKAAFTNESSGTWGAERTRLMTELLGARERVEGLLTGIPQDCRDLTIHDVTHLDALWEAADLICGERILLNPAETFVLGLAILTHDAGLTSLAYEGGKAALKKTQIWQDFAAQYFYSRSGVDTSEQLTPSQEGEVLFSVLRALHADEAIRLCKAEWKYGSSGPIHIVSDPELREAYAETAGRIAASHNWDSKKLTDELSSSIGGSPKLPSDWTINEVKLACILRCADAAQVDRRRAPLALYSAIKPSGYSQLHWEAQLKLNKPHIKNDTIYFSSSSTFATSEADAWWVAYDLARVLDFELKSANAILTDIGENTLIAQRVAGADTPDAFAKYVKTAQWRPVDASVKVTDPLRLASTLGGRNLYGNDPRVPFRELIQNAADAIRAKRALEKRGQDFGQITITIEQDPSNADDCLVSIDDNGVGMSERVLSGSLVDFGRSFWNSSAVREEFPGLQGTNFQKIGKFGIGFFSVFSFSKAVRVISRRHDSAVSDAKVLEFRSFSNRPLLRAAMIKELPMDTHTRVSFSLAKKFFEFSTAGLVLRRAYFEDDDWGGRRNDLIMEVARLVSFLDIKVVISDRRNGKNFVHQPDIYEVDASNFLTGLYDQKEARRFFDPVKLLAALKAEDGDAYGRAALDVDALLDRQTRSVGFVSVGGIVSQGRSLELKSSLGESLPYMGVIEGDTERAARDFVSSKVPQSVVDNWFNAQINAVDDGVLTTSERMKLSAFAFLATGFETSLPFAFHMGRVKTVSEIREAIRKTQTILLPMWWRYDSWVELRGYNDLQPDYFEADLSVDVFVLSEGSQRLVDDEDARTLRRNESMKLSATVLSSKWKTAAPLLKLIHETWGVEPSVEIRKASIFQTRVSSLSGARWVLALDKPVNVGAKH